MNSTDTSKTAGSRAAACKDFRSQMPDLLLESNVSPEPGLEEHFAICAACSAEWRELQSLMATLDEWQVPEPSAFFDTRLHARLQEELASPPEGFFERLRSFLLFSTGRQLRPALAGALALILVVGGGSGFVGLHDHLTAMHGTSATLNDLKVLDNNAQALQQMDQLLDEGGGDETAAAPTT